MAIERSPSIGDNQQVQLATHGPYARHLPPLTRDEVERALPQSAWARALRTELPHPGLHLPPGTSFGAAKGVVTAVKQLARGELPAVPLHHLADFLAFADYADAQPLIDAALRAMRAGSVFEVRAHLAAIAPQVEGSNAYAQAQGALVAWLAQHGDGLAPSHDAAEDSRLAGLLLTHAEAKLQGEASAFVARCAPMGLLISRLRSPDPELRRNLWRAWLPAVIARATPDQGVAIMDAWSARTALDEGAFVTEREFLWPALGLQPSALRIEWVQTLLRTLRVGDVLLSDALPLLRTLGHEERTEALRGLPEALQEAVLSLARSDHRDPEVALACLQAMGPAESAAPQVPMLWEAMLSGGEHFDLLWAQVPAVEQPGRLLALSRLLRKAPVPALRLRWVFAQLRALPAAGFKRHLRRNALHDWARDHGAKVLSSALARDPASLAECIAVLRETGTLPTALRDAFKPGTEYFRSQLTHATLSLCLDAAAQVPQLDKAMASAMSDRLREDYGDRLAVLLEHAPRWLSSEAMCAALERNRSRDSAPASLALFAAKHGMVSRLCPPWMLAQWWGEADAGRVRALLTALDASGGARAALVADDFDALRRASWSLMKQETQDEGMERVLDLCARLDDADLRRALVSFASPFRGCAARGRGEQLTRLCGMAIERLGHADLPAYLSLAMDECDAAGVRRALMHADNFAVLDATLSYKGYAAFMAAARPCAVRNGGYEQLLERLVARGHLEGLFTAVPEVLTLVLKTDGTEPVRAAAGARADVLFVALRNAALRGEPWADIEHHLQRMERGLASGYHNDRRHLVRQHCPVLRTHLEHEAERRAAWLEAPEPPERGCSIM